MHWDNAGDAQLLNAQAQVMPVVFARIWQFGRPYFVPTMQRATPGILTLPSSS